MEIILKKLKENDSTIFPITSAEAILIKNDNSEVITLDKYLSKKTKIVVNELDYKEITGSEDQELKFSDDFETDDTGIKLKWG